MRKTSIISFKISRPTSRPRIILYQKSRFCLWYIFNRRIYRSSFAAPLSVIRSGIQVECNTLRRKRKPWYYSPDQSFFCSWIHFRSSQFLLFISFTCTIVWCNRTELDHGVEIYLTVIAGWGSVSRLSRRTNLSHDPKRSSGNSTPLTTRFTTYKKTAIFLNA